MKKISLDFGGLAGREGDIASSTLQAGGYDSAADNLRRDAEALEKGREVASKVRQLQKDVTWANAVKPLLDGIKERDGSYRGRKIILVIDELHSQIPAQKTRTP